MEAPPSAPENKPQNLSPEEKKQIAGEHLKALLEQKKRRLKQTPAWKMIEHHDHPAPRSDSSGEAAHGEAGVPATTSTGVRTRGDRGGG